MQYIREMSGNKSCLIYYMVKVHGFNEVGYGPYRL